MFGNKIGSLGFPSLGIDGFIGVINGFMDVVNLDLRI
jgi:hypothetical protein